MKLFLIILCLGLLIGGCQTTAINNPNQPSGAAWQGQEIDDPWAPPVQPKKGQEAKNSLLALSRENDRITRLWLVKKIVKQIGRGAEKLIWDYKQGNEEHGAKLKRLQMRHNQRGLDPNNQASNYWWGGHEKVVATAYKNLALSPFFLGTIYQNSSYPYERQMYKFVFKEKGVPGLQFLKDEELRVLRQKAPALACEINRIMAWRIANGLDNQTLAFNKKLFLEGQAELIGRDGKKYTVSLAKGQETTSIRKIIQAGLGTGWQNAAGESTDRWFFGAMLAANIFKKQLIGPLDHQLVVYVAAGLKINSGPAEWGATAGVRYTLIADRWSQSISERWEQCRIWVDACLYKIAVGTTQGLRLSPVWQAGLTGGIAYIWGTPGVVPVFSLMVEKRLGKILAELKTPPGRRRFLQENIRWSPLRTKERVALICEQYSKMFGRMPAESYWIFLAQCDDQERFEEYFAKFFAQYPAKDFEWLRANKNIPLAKEMRQWDPIQSIGIIQADWAGLGFLATLAVAKNSYFLSEFNLDKFAAGMREVFINGEMALKSAPRDDFDMTPQGKVISEITCNQIEAHPENGNRQLLKIQPLRRPGTVSFCFTNKKGLMLSFAKQGKSYDRADTGNTVDAFDLHLCREANSGRGFSSLFLQHTDVDSRGKVGAKSLFWFIGPEQDLSEDAMDRFTRVLADCVVVKGKNGTKKTVWTNIRVLRPTFGANKGWSQHSWQDNSTNYPVSPLISQAGALRKNLSVKVLGGQNSKYWEGILVPHSDIIGVQEFLPVTLGMFWQWKHYSSHGASPLNPRRPSRIGGGPVSNP